MTEDVFLLLTECVRGKGPEDYVFTRDGQHMLQDLVDAAITRRHFASPNNSI